MTSFPCRGHDYSAHEALGNSLTARCGRHLRGGDADHFHFHSGCALAVSVESTRYMKVLVAFDEFMAAVGASTKEQLDSDHRGLLGACGGVACASNNRVTGSTMCVEGEPEDADGEFVTVRKKATVDRVAVDIATIQRAKVRQHKPSALQADLGVLAGDGNVR